MNNLVEIAESYKGINVSKLKDLVRYYNEECLHLVPPTKRHVMSLGENWCGMFVSVIARMGGLCRNEFPYGVSVYEMTEQAKRWGSYRSAKFGAREGDLIVFDWNGNGVGNHIGFVVKASEELLVTIEGNYSNTVKNRHLKPSSSSIMGYISIGEAYQESPISRLEGLAERVILGEFGEGEERRKILGSDFEAVQKIVNRMMK